MKTYRWMAGCAAAAALWSVTSAVAAVRIEPESVQVVGEVPAGMRLADGFAVNFTAYSNRPLAEIGAKQLRYEAARRGVAIVLFVKAVSSGPGNGLVLSPSNPSAANGVMLQPQRGGQLLRQGGNIGGSFLRRHGRVPRHGFVVGVALEAAPADEAAAAPKPD